MERRTPQATQPPELGFSKLKGMIVDDGGV
jgi:hypothetical protein